MKQLLDTIEKAKEILNLSERELSTKIGQHYTYLGKIKKKGTSERNQQVIIEKIVNLMNGNPVTEAEIIENLSLWLQAEQDKAILLQAAIVDKNTEIMNLRRKVERVKLHRYVFFVFIVLLSFSHVFF